MTVSERIAALFGGMDKVAHFGVGGTLCASVTLLVNSALSGLVANFPWLLLLTPFIGTSLVTLLEIFKEKKLDPSVDWKDVIATLYGCGCVHIVSIFGWIAALLF